MSTPAAESAVRHTRVVNAPQARAFAAFTRGIGRWWPRSHHLVKGEVVEMVFDEHAGGHIHERDAAGNHCAWARILVYDAPHRVVFTWDITPTWELEQDPGRASEVEVRFIAEGADRTRVELEHRHIERHGPEWGAMRDGVAGERGWPLVLHDYATSVAA